MSMLKPTLKQLNYLIAIAEEGSFSRAAERCSVTQSTMSAAIQELEDILSQRVVTRGSRIATLTPLGEEILAQAHKINQEIDAIMAYARAKEKPLSGSFRLGVIPTIAPYILPEILPEIQKKYASLNLQIHEDLTGRLLEKLQHGKLDAVLMAFPYDTANFETCILFEEAFVLAYPKTRKTPTTLTITDLNGDDLLLLEDGHCMRDQALSACNLKISEKRKTFSATSLPTLIQMVGHGYGVTLLPQMALNHLPDTVKLAKFKGLTPTRQIGLAWKKNAAPKQDLKAFLELMHKFLEKNDNFK